MDPLRLYVQVQSYLGNTGGLLIDDQIDLMSLDNQVFPFLIDHLFPVFTDHIHIIFIGLLKKLVKIWKTWFDTFLLVVLDHQRDDQCFELLLLGRIWWALLLFSGFLFSKWFFDWFFLYLFIQFECFHHLVIFLVYECIPWKKRTEMDREKLINEISKLFKFFFHYFLLYLYTILFNVREIFWNQTTGFFGTVYFSFTLGLRCAS